jgi:hypothetical protein
MIKTIPPYAHLVFYSLFIKVTLENEDAKVEARDMDLGEPLCRLLAVLIRIFVVSICFHLRLVDQ